MRNVYKKMCPTPQQQKYQIMNPKSVILTFMWYAKRVFVCVYVCVYMNIYRV